MRVLVTRPAEQAAEWVHALRELGVDAVALPLIAIAPLADRAAVAQAWSGLGAVRLAMFVSANAVAHFFAARPEAAAWPAGTLAGATGPGTVRALRAAGVPASQIVAPADDAPRFDSEALWQLVQALPWTGAQVLIVRGEDGRDWLAEQLHAAGARVTYLAAYRRVVPELDAPARSLLDVARASPREHLFAFSSSEAVANLRQWLPGADWRDFHAVATHPRIAAAAREAGFGRVDVVAPVPRAFADWLNAR